MIVVTLPFEGYNRKLFIVVSDSIMKPFRGLKRKKNYAKPRNTNHAQKHMDTGSPDPEPTGLSAVQTFHQLLRSVHELLNASQNFHSKKIL